MDLNVFKEYGEQARKRIYAGRSSNAARNKCISYASALRDATNTGNSKVMDTLIQLSIYTELPVDKKMTEGLATEHGFYKEAGMMVALALLSF